MNGNTLLLAVIFALIIQSPYATAQVSSEPSINAETQRKIWHRAYSDRIEYGITQSDDRLLWISCENSDFFQIGGPALSATALQDKISITFSRISDGATQTLNGHIIEMGDGPNFVVNSWKDGLAISTLIKGDAVTVTTTDISWIVTGEGANTVLIPLFQYCESKKTSHQHMTKQPK